MTAAMGGDCRPSIAAVKFGSHRQGVILHPHPAHQEGSYLDDGDVARPRWIEHRTPHRIKVSALPTELRARDLLQQRVPRQVPPECSPIARHDPDGHRLAFVWRVALGDQVVRNIIPEQFVGQCVQLGLTLDGEGYCVGAFGEVAGR